MIETIRVDDLAATADHLSDDRAAGLCAAHGRSLLRVAALATFGNFDRHPRERAACCRQRRDGFIVSERIVSRIGGIISSQRLEL
jgi:hypothetical protein